MRISTKALLAQSLYADVAGLQADYEHNTYTRLAGARGRSAGTDFDGFAPFGGRRRCCVADDGTINAFYGDAGYTEDGSGGQVMVYQPAFYYRMEPLKLVRQSSGEGYLLRKANYYLSASPKPGFRRHPAFFGENGDPVDYILLSAYEASYYDASLGRFFSDGTDTDAAVDAVADRLCSLPGKKPICGPVKPLTRATAETLANTRGAGWHIDTIKSCAANQLLMLVEYGTASLLTAAAPGLINVPSTDGVNCASLTGSTAPLGNRSGEADATVNECGGATATYRESGKVAFSYRGQENPWGNVWKMLEGITQWGDGTKQGGVPYICADYRFAEDKTDGNYRTAGFMIAGGTGYITAFGFSEEADWLFLPAEIKTGTAGAAASIGSNYTYQSPNLNGYRIYAAGGFWDHGNTTGIFTSRCLYPADRYIRSFGCRLLYVP